MAAEPRARAVLERIDELDVTRGLAVFGILVANMAQYFLPDLLSDKPVSIRGEAAADAMSWFLVHAFVDNKFLTLFSALFGISFALLRDKLSTRGTGRHVLSRRFIALFLFGLIHGLFFYYADILLGYAVAAMLLWLMSGIRPRVLLMTGIALLLIVVGPWRYLISGPEPGAKERPHIVASAAAELSTGLDQMDAGSSEQVVTRKFSRAETADAWDEITAYRKGPISASLSERLEHFVSILIVIGAYVLWRSLGLFMIGAALYRSGWLMNRSTRDWGHLTLWLLPAGVLANLAVSYLLYRDYVDPGGFTSALAVADDLVALLLASGYASLVFWLVKARPANWFGARIANVGRTALSNYLGQSIVMSIVATHYGLSLFGELSRTELIWTAIVFFIVQIIASHWWMSRFRYGPLEWVWRCFTYWSLLPNRDEAQTMNSVKA